MPNSGTSGAAAATAAPTVSQPGSTVVTAASSAAAMLTASAVASSPAAAAGAGALTPSNAPLWPSRPVPMKLFATWEVDRTPPNCIPRLCTLTLTRLVLHKCLGPDLSSVIIAVKMQSSKRTLRSNEIELPSSGLLDTQLELTFSLQYPHFLKREGNQLHVMLQRRKKYKNRTILGFKTLAIGTINMSQVLQKQMDLEMELMGEMKENKSAVGRVYLLSLSSQPVDHEDSANGRTKVSSGDGGDRDLIYSDDDDDFSSNEEGSDSEPLMLDEVSMHHHRVGDGQQGGPGASRRFSRKSGRSGGAGGSASKASSAAFAASAARQRNLKQKFVALLKKFKVPDPEDLEHERVSLDQKLSESNVDPADIEDLIDQLDDLSDSGPEVDTISIGSTPKPSLKPFFNSSRSLLHEVTRINEDSAVSSHHHVGMDRLSDDSSREGVSDSHPDLLTDPELSDPQAINTSSPPQSGDELRTYTYAEKAKRRARLFSKETKDKKEGPFSLKQQKIGGVAVGGGLGLATAASAAANAGMAVGGAAGGGIVSSASAHLPQMLVTTTASSSSITPSASLVNNAVGSLVAASRAEKAGADSLSPRKVLLEQLSRVLPADGDSLPEQVILANTCDRQGAHLAAKLAERGHRVVCTAGPADVRAALACILAKITSFCHTSTQVPPSVRVVLIGSDAFINSLLRPYVEVFSSKPPDWQTYVKFYIIPLGVNSVSRYIGTHDATYASLFVHESWRELIEKAEPGKSDVSEIVSRITQYLSCPSDSLLLLPVAEAMVTYKEKSSDEESSQVFVPFVSEVRVTSGTGAGGAADIPSFAVSSVDAEESSVTTIGDPSMGSPPHTSLSLSLSAAGAGATSIMVSPGGDRSNRDKLTPPSSPNVAGKEGSRAEFFSEPVELQLDYWVLVPTSASQGLEASSSVSAAPSALAQKKSDAGSTRADSKKLSGGGGMGGGGATSHVGSAGYSAGTDMTTSKLSIKTNIRYMLVQRSANPDAATHNAFAMQYWVKEKKTKAVMRLGKKKDKDSDVKSQVVDGITRLICLSKAHTPLKVHIDGWEWQGVKFFQLSSQWQTHIKHLPVATFKQSAHTAL